MDIKSALGAGVGNINIFSLEGIMELDPECGQPLHWPCDWLDVRDVQGQIPIFDPVLVLIRTALQLIDGVIPENVDNISIEYLDMIQQFRKQVEKDQKDFK